MSYFNHGAGIRPNIAAETFVLLTFSALGSTLINAFEGPDKPRSPAHLPLPPSINRPIEYNSESNALAESELPGAHRPIPLD